MEKKSLYETVAKAVRIEHDIESDTLYVVFEITDERFKKEIKDDWTRDIDLEVIGRSIKKFKE